MELSREEVEAIAEATAIYVVGRLHRYTVEYKEPATVRTGLRESMAEEETATDWYRRRAKNARENNDESTAGLYTHIAEEEEAHHREFQRQLQITGQHANA